MTNVLRSIPVVWQMLLDWTETDQDELRQIIENMQLNGARFMSYGTWYGCDDNGVKMTGDYVWLRFMSTRDLLEKIREANNGEIVMFDGHLTLKAKES